MRQLPGLIVFAIGCHLEGPGPAGYPGPVDQPAPVVHAPEQPGAEPRLADDPPPADPCDPLPRGGAACTTEASWCVIDWGEACGASTAAWCRNGVWVYEEEANLCD
jgi:hypothetical protein